MPKRMRHHRPHRLQRQYDDRPSAARRGYDRKWRRYRLLFLAQHPMCVECLAVATEVDHIIPIIGQHDPKFWDEANHQALCHRCHSAKTLRDMGRKTTGVTRGPADDSRASHA